MESISRVAALGPVTEQDGLAVRAVLIEVTQGVGGPTEKWVVGEEYVGEGRAPVLRNSTDFEPQDKTLAVRSYCDCILVQATEEDRREEPALSA